MCHVVNRSHPHGNFHADISICTNVYADCGDYLEKPNLHSWNKHPWAHGWMHVIHEDKKVLM